jgi:K+-transporting ATPase ATPase C chain
MKNLMISLRIFLFFTLLTGVFYPLFVTGIAQVAFHRKANGSILMNGEQAVGSELIGQQFDSSIYFTPRPSAIFYNPLPSGGSNYGLTNIKLKNLVDERRHQFIKFNQLDSMVEIPSEMLFASASGLDPHISPQAALLQVERISNARNFNHSQKQELLGLVSRFTEAPWFLCFGEERINVLLLNLETDKIK